MKFSRRTVAAISGCYLGIASVDALIRSELPYINELHYDNIFDERVEVAVNASDTTTYEISLFVGDSDAAVFTTYNSNDPSVAKISAADTNGIKYIVFTISGIWDGPGKVYLSDGFGYIERLTYEGRTSTLETDIGVVENGTEPPKFSLQRQLRSTTWLAPRLNTFGAATVAVELTNAPTKAPTRQPTVQPHKETTKNPGPPPTKQPTQAPTKAPTTASTKQPTNAPIKAPTNQPTHMPTKAPTQSPGNSPSIPPVKVPSIPTSVPIVVAPPVAVPVKSPTQAPTMSPTNQPTNAPSSAPIFRPVNVPISMAAPTIVAPPVPVPMKAPTKAPTRVPIPVPIPVKIPMKPPTKAPVNAPSNPTVTNSPITAPTENCGIFGLNLLCLRPGKCGLFKRLLNLGSCD